jgi:transcriptional regulator
MNRADLVGSEATMTGFYNPAAFRVDDLAQLGHIIDAAVFGTLVTNGAEGPLASPLASHVPFLLDRKSGTCGTLRAHLARANEHWKVLDSERALVIFHGPQHYVTPSWYASKAVTGKVVPTWNYVVVHVRGRVHVHHDAARLRALVEALTNHMEAPRARPWGVDDAPSDFVAQMLDQIVGVDLEIEHIEGKLKLGQNRSAADRASLAAGLAQEQPEVWASLTAVVPASRPDGSG